MFCERLFSEKKSLEKHILSILKRKLVPNCLITWNSLKNYNRQSEIVRNFDSFNLLWTNLEGCLTIGKPSSKEIFLAAKWEGGVGEGWGCHFQV